jgi:transketolase
VSTPSRATDLREALLAETLDEVVRLHDTVQAIAPKLHAALAEATTEAKKEVTEHAQAQAFYMEQTMLKDREKFTQEQKSALEELDQRLKDRDAALTALMADILAKARTQLAAEMQEAVQKATAGRQKQQRALFAAMLLGMLLTIVGTGAGAWLSTATGCGQ